MTLRYSEDVRNAGLDARVSAIGAAPTLTIYDANGEAIVAFVLPKVWMNKAANGVVQKTGQWQSVAHHDGNAASFKISDAGGKDHVEGEIPGDMTLDNPSLKRGQNVIVGRFIISAGNAAANG